VERKEPLEGWCLVRAQAVTSIGFDRHLASIQNLNMRAITHLSRLRSSAAFNQVLSKSIYPHHVECASGRVSIQPHQGYTTRSFSSQPNDPGSDVSFQPANRLSGRRCLITGGTSGIGFAIAERFLQEGASTIVLVGRSQKRLEEAASRLAPFSNGSPIEELNGEVATRTPEEDMQNSSGNIRILVGDVSNAGSWMRELEKEMVRCAIH
jgi:FlaA1/EpsC-like NDP-sugar epimerase